MFLLTQKGTAAPEHVLDHDLIIKFEVWHKVNIRLCRGLYICTTELSTDQSFPVFPVFHMISSQIGPS
jgi:hypothetical protein